MTSGFHFCRNLYPLGDAWSHHKNLDPSFHTASVEQRSWWVSAFWNTRRKSQDSRWTDPEGKVSEKATAITWTLWGKVAVNASWHLDVGSKVAVVGTLEGNRYTGKDGKEVFGFNFTARSVEYLESKDDAEARRNRRANSAGEREPKPARPAGRKTSRSPASGKEA